jgi:hypothetical protein
VKLNPDGTLLLFTGAMDVGRNDDCRSSKSSLSARREPTVRSAARDTIWSHSTEVPGKPAALYQRLAHPEGGSRESASDVAPGCWRRGRDD